MKKASEYKIRELCRKDRVVLSRMIEKVADKVVGTKILDLITAVTPQEGKEVDGGAKTKLGIEILRLLMGTLNEDVTEWFASLLGLSVDEFNDNTPFNIELEIVRQLQEADDVTDFFTGVSQQFSTILGSKIRSEAKKKK